MRTIAITLAVVLASALATGCAYRETVVERPVAAAPTTYVVPADPAPAAIIVRD